MCLPGMPRLGPSVLAALVTSACCAGCGTAQPAATVTPAAAGPAVTARTTATARTETATTRTSAGTRLTASTTTSAGTRLTASTTTSAGTRLTASTTTTTTPRMRTSAARHPRPARAAGPRRPRIVWDPVPFGHRRKAEMTAYVRRHYSSFMKPTWRLVHPHVIVIHYTEASYGSTYNTFADDVPDSELHELPATSAHFVIDTGGTVHQLVSLGTMARHAVGLNWTAIGIEHVGFSDAQVLGDRRQITASLHLVHWLRCRYAIQIRNVIGHNESVSSPYHHEDMASLRSQTHSDFNRADMNVYRQRLRTLGGC